MYPVLALMSNTDDAVSSRGATCIVVGAVCFLFVMQERRPSMLYEAAGVGDEASELQVRVPAVCYATLVYSMQAASLTPLQLQRKMAVKLIAWVAFSRALFCCAPRQSKDSTNGEEL
jgi:hypothetical protein